MIKEIKKNELTWVLPYELREYTTDQVALELVNSSTRQLIINGFIVVSTKKDDLNYIYDLFDRVIIKRGKINSITFYGIEYATNYYDFKAQKEYFEKKLLKDLKINDWKNLLSIVKLVKGEITVEEVKERKKEHQALFEKIGQRASNKYNNKENLKTIKKRALKKLIDQKLSQYQSFNTESGTTLYLHDGVLYRKNDILKLNHPSLFVRF